MHVLFFLLILLAFPVLEIWLLIELTDRYGWSLLVYLAVVALLGWRLVQDEKQLIFSRFAQTFAAGGTPAKVLLGSAKNLLAGVLLLIPGIVTDLFAVILLLIPSPKPVMEQDTSAGFADQLNRQSRQAANDNVIEGEYRRED
jgi:UPF0716 protein FxsA